MGLARSGKTLEAVFQRELNDPWGYRCTGDNTKARLIERVCGGIELSMVPNIKELGSELQARILSQPTHPRVLDQGNIPVVLAGSRNDSHGGISEPGTASRTGAIALNGTAYARLRREGIWINVTVDTRLNTAWSRNWDSGLTDS